MCSCKNHKKPSIKKEEENKKSETVKYKTVMIDKSVKLLTKALQLN